MLNFEDFFAKKKIDLAQLHNAEPDLFAEFSIHYPLMGEKSFDHTKKYWFNNLRRLYPLSTEIKPHAVKAEAISQMAVQGVAVAAAQNLNEAIEKPKFKEDNLPGLVEENVPVKEVSLAEEEKTIIENEAEIPVAKPVFKPRFNIQNIKKDVVKEVLKTEAEVSKSEEKIQAEPEIEKPEPTIKPTENNEAKPVYKPRFQMKNIPKPAAENLPPATESE